MSHVVQAVAAQGHADPELQAARWRNCKLVVLLLATYDAINESTSASYTVINGELSTKRDGDSEVASNMLLPSKGAPRWLRRDTLAETCNIPRELNE